jgi:maleylacetoacetate isomerase
VDTVAARSYARKNREHHPVKLFTFWRSLATYRVRIALNLKGIKPEVVYVDLIKGHQRAPEFKAVNPQMVIPALVDGDGPILFQSLAIIEYLDEVHPHPPLLPTDPRARAFVRGIAQIVACDSHPLVVPRIRNYLTDELKLDEPARMKWIRHWISEALAAIESHLANDGMTGRCCCGDRPTIADICVASQAAGAGFFEVDLKPYPTVSRVVDACMQIEAFAAAHPLKQPGAPDSKQ